jgi:hypothetical protein
MNERGVLLLDQSLWGLGALGDDAAAWAKIAKITNAASMATFADPTVGTIVKAAAIVTGLIAKSRLKVSALKSQKTDIVKANQDLRLQSIELDKMIVDSKAATDSVNSELKKAGLRGLDGLFDWVKETIAPNKTVGTQIKTQADENTRLIAEIEGKIGVLESMRKGLEDLQAELTGGKKIILYGGIAAGGIALYFIAKHFNWI